MTGNFPTTLQSKMWCSLGRGEHEQVREGESRSAATAPARRAAAVARCAAGGGRPPSRCDTHDGEYLERTARVRRAAGAQPPATGPTLGLGCAAEGRAGAVAQGRSTSTRVRYGAVDAASGRAADRGEVRPSIQREPSVADSGGLGLQQPAAHE